MGTSEIEEFCSEACGELRPAAVDWLDAPVVPVCLVDHSSRERNPYTDLWGINCRKPPAGDYASWRGSEEPCLAIEVQGGRVEDVEALSDQDCIDSDQLQSCYKYSDCVFVPVDLGWKSSTIEAACLVDKSDKEYHTYEVYEFIFPGAATSCYSDGAGTPEAYFTISVNEELERQFSK